MCSIATEARRNTPSAVGVLARHASEVAEALGSVLAAVERPVDLAGIPDAALAELVTSLMAAAGRLTAAATLVTGQLETSGAGIPGRMIAGRYASTRRFLEVEAGLSSQSAGAMVARARDLRDDSRAVAAAWLAGEVSGDAVREMSVGIRQAVRHLPLAQRDSARELAITTILPVARAGTVSDVRRAVQRLRFTLDPDGVTQAAMDAYDDQSLACDQVGSMSRLTAWLTHEAAAATMTVLGQRVDAQLRVGEGCGLPEGIEPESPAGRRFERERRRRLLAVALGETMTALLDDNRVGSHHGVAPHVTAVIDLDDALAQVASGAPGLAGTLLSRCADDRFLPSGVRAAMLGSMRVPGDDEPALLPEVSLRRLLCDSDVTTVLVRHPTSCGESGARATSAIAASLREVSREVLYVGRAERVVTPCLRRALEARDRHCTFPGCRAHVGRCNAHHVLPWEDGGGTDLDNLSLLCVRHHHAVHEGRWRMTRTPGVGARESGCWTFHPPDRPGRP